jgi:hypothetical protein
MTMGDSTSLFKKAYQSLEGRGFSSIGDRVGFSNSRSSRTSSESSSSWMNSSASFSRSDSSESRGVIPHTSSIGSVIREIPGTVLIV